MVGLDDVSDNVPPFESQLILLATLKITQGSASCLQQHNFYGITNEQVAAFSVVCNRFFAPQDFSHPKGVSPKSEKHAFCS